MFFCEKTSSSLLPRLGRPLQPPRGHPGSVEEGPAEEDADGTAEGGHHCVKVLKKMFCVKN